MREVGVPFVRRHVRALGHVAHVAEITVVDDVPVELFGHAIEFHRVGFVDGVEQGRERVAEIEAAATAVTDIEDALQLGVERRIIVELVGPPVDRMASWRLEAALACDFRVGHIDGPDPEGPGRFYLVVESVECFLEAVSVRALCLGERLEPVCDFVEAFIACRLRHARVHVGVLMGFAGNSGGEVG